MSIVVVPSSTAEGTRQAAGGRLQMVTLGTASSYDTAQYDGIQRHMYRCKAGKSDYICSTGSQHRKARGAGKVR